MEGMVIDAPFWRGRRVFVTGHTGFKGGWLTIWLESLGAQVFGYALAPPSSPSLFVSANVGSRVARSTIGDIRELAALEDTIRTARPEIVFHLAGQSLVRRSYNDAVGTYATNVMGTVNLFEALRHTSGVRAVVNVTTDKVYENHEWVWGYREDDRLGGSDPYSSSKACSEMVTSAYRASFFDETHYDTHKVAIATARAGNVIGGGDWGESRLVPDCVRAFSKNEKVTVRFPVSTRPWQHVLDALSGYLLLAKRLVGEGPRFSGAWNFSPYRENVRSVGWVVERLTALWGGGAGYATDTGQNPHEATMLALDNSKAVEHLGWKPRWQTEEALSMTVQWFKDFLNGSDPYRLCIGQIHTYGGEQ